MKGKKLLKYFGITVVVLIIFVIIGKSAGFLGKDYLVKVAVEKSEKRTIVETITANGKIQPETEVKISPDVSGEIVELNVKEGQEIKQGDLLLKIKPDIYQSALERMEASLNTSRSNLANAQARVLQVQAQFKQAELNFQRNKKLFEQQTISQADFDNISSNYEVAKAEVEAAKQNVNAATFAINSSEAALKEARENLTKTTIYAPINGTISKLNVEKGERVVGTSQMAGTELLKIANLNKMEVLVDVNENDIVKVSLKDTAYIEIDAYLGQKFKGLVNEIANSATTAGALGTDQVTNFQVKISILPESYQHLIPKNAVNIYPFRPGMSATVDIRTETKFNVLSVPIQAVTTRIDSTGVMQEKSTVEKSTGNSPDMSPFDNSQGQKKRKDKNDELKEVVFCYKNGIVEMFEVKTGVQDNNYIEIVSGLTSDSLEIVVAPYNAIAKKLKNKQKVEKTKKEDLFNAKEMQ